MSGIWPSARKLPPGRRGTSGSTGGCPLRRRAAREISALVRIHYRGLAARVDLDLPIMCQLHGAQRDFRVQLPVSVRRRDQSDSWHFCTVRAKYD
jgi:hypothetical protein